MRFPRLLFVAVSLLPLAAFAAPKLTVEAGDFDRQNTIVPFQAPASLHGDFTLRGEGGEAVPVQVDVAGHGVFVLPKLAKGGHETLTFSPPSQSLPALTAKQEGDVVKVAAGDSAIFSYQTTPGPVPADVPAAFSHGAHLHPIFTPSGKLVTGNHPTDHRWHRGVWLGWTDTDFEGRHPDFWNMGKEADMKLTGEVRFASLKKTWGGPVQAGFVSHHRFIDHTSGAEKDVLAETWNVFVTRLPQANVIDLVSTQTTAGQTALKLPKYHYGGLGVRGNLEWNPVDKVTMLTSNGDDRIKGDGTKAKWVQLGGAVDGQPTGMVILISPENFRFPQPLRLNPKNPQLCIAPSAEGDWSIEPGQPYVSKYRLLIVDGAADAAAYDRAWNDYATPPKVTVAE